MNARKLLLLIVVAVIALALAIALRSRHAAPVQPAEQDKPLLPALRDHVNDVSGITLTGAGGKVIATLARGKDGWTIAERAGYPADVAAIRGLLVKLGGSTVVEPKTTNPQRYPDIGVDDVADKDAKGVEVDVAGLSAPVKIIVGSYSPQGAGTFVRRAGEAQSWLASGDLSISKAVADWEKRDIVDLASGRVASVTLTAPDGKTLKVYKQRQTDPDFSVANVPQGRQVQQGMAVTIATALSGLRVDEVFSAKDMPAPDQVHKAEYVAFYGVTIDATVWSKDGKDYAQFQAKLDRAAAQKRIADEQAKAKAAYEAARAAKPAATSATGATSAQSATDQHPSGNPQLATIPKPQSVADPAADMQARLDTLAKQVDALNRTFSGWTFVLPSYVFGNMTKTMSDVLAPVKPANNPQAAGAKVHPHS